MSGLTHQEPLGRAACMLANVPQAIDRIAWYEQDEALGYHLLHTVAKAMVLHTDEALQDAGQAHGALRQHAKLIAGDAVPVVLARDGQHTIGYEQLAEARAKSTVLQQELQAARASNHSAKALLSEVAGCLTRDQELTIDLQQRINDWLLSTPELTSQAAQAIASEEAFDTQARARELAGREFNAGRQAMHTDIMSLLSRRLGEMTAASKRHPQVAVQLTQAAGVLEVARKQIQEIRP